MRWRFSHDTVEDLLTSTWHRPGCGEFAPQAVTVRHPARSSVARDVAPRQCWTCQPEVDIVIGV
jgi:hypothetical protein